MKKIFLSAILAGAVIAFGGTVFLSVENTVVGSLFFTIGLFVVCTRPSSAAMRITISPFSRST